MIAHLGVKRMNGAESLFLKSSRDLGLFLLGDKLTGLLLSYL